MTPKSHKGNQQQVMKVNATRANEKAPFIKCLLYKNKDLSLGPQYPCENWLWQPVSEILGLQKQSQEELGVANQ